MNVEHLDAGEVARRLAPLAAVDALEAALRAGLDPEADPPRSKVDIPGGQLLAMPSAATGRAVVKLVTVGGDPHVQGLAVVFDPVTLAPVALVDGIALTNLRTSAVSALAVRHLAEPGAARLVVFGLGPQAHAHVAAVEAVRPIVRVDLVGRHHDPAAVAELVAAADVICCCTTSRTPLFDGGLVASHATVVAIGAHEPDARETDDALAGRATVVVESLASARREAGDVVAAVAAGVLDERSLVALADVVRGAVIPDPGRPRLFKSTGMSWEDAVVATALVGSPPAG